jgi:drug/metabolite transporter (DMT)-like permease
MASVGFVDNFIRVIAEDVGLWQFHAFRSAMAMVLILAAVPVLGLRLRPRRIGAVLWRTFLNSVSMLCYFGALSSMSIAAAGAGLFTSPIWVLLISVVLFRAQIGLWRILAMALGFAGVLLVLRPGGGGIDLMALIAVMAGLFYAASSLATRRMCSEESPEALLLAFFAMIGSFGVLGLLGLAWTGVATPLEAGNFFTTEWQAPTPRFLGLCLFQAVGSLIPVFCLIKAYQMADPSYVSVFENSFLLFAGLWAYLLWGEVPDTLAIFGIFAIVVSGSVIILRSRG